MKKFSKVVLIAAAVCFALGLTITAAAAMAGGAGIVKARVTEALHRNGNDRYVYDDDWDDYFDDDWDDRYDDDYDDWDDYLEHELLHHHSSQSLPQTQPSGQQQSAGNGAGQAQDSGQNGIYTVTSQLEIEVEMGRVEIVEGDTGDNIQVQIFSDEIQMRSEIEGNERKLEFRPAGSGLTNISSDARVVVTVPKGYEFGKLNLDAGAGIITADRISARQLELDASAGSVRVTNGAAGQLEADCSAGKLEYAGSIASSLKAECEAGNMEFRLNGKKEDFSYNLEVEGGSVRIQDETFGRTKRQSVSNRGAVKTASLESELGNITIDFTN